MRRGQPHKMADVLGELMARHGFARRHAAEDIEQAWRIAAGEVMAAHTRVGSVRRGVLEVAAESSAFVQEINLRKAELVAALSEQLPDGAIRDIKCRVGKL